MSARTLEEPPPRRPAYFWWLLANALALCFAVTSWAVCLQVFGNPEMPRNYMILKKLKRLPEQKRYTILDVPNGNSFSPNSLYRKFFGFNKDELEKLNSKLLRNYLTNFDQPLLLTYVEGDYRVESSRTLGAQDFLNPGFAVRTQAMVKPDDFTKAAPYPVLVDYLFPTVEVDSIEDFRSGDVIPVKKSPQCAVIVHVSKVIKDDEPVLCLTVVPIAYGPYHMGNVGTFTVEPPQNIRPGAPLPLFKP